MRDAACCAIAIAVARADAGRASRGQRLHLGADREVAILFAGIFTCIIPVLPMLQAGKDGTLRLAPRRRDRRDGTPHEVAYFWLTGVLSAFLDNAPTYLVFFELAGGEPRELMGPLAPTLAAISMGAVYMGALTYIGNAPNFMIYAIAIERGVKMPSFFGYMLWSAAVLLPVLALITFVSCRAALTLRSSWRRLWPLPALLRLGAAGSTAIASTSSCAPARASPRSQASCWRAVSPSEIAVAHLAQDRQVVDVDEIVVELHHVLEAAADRGERGLQVLEHLHRLGAEVADRPCRRGRCRAGRRCRRCGPAPVTSTTWV